MDSTYRALTVDHLDAGNGLATKATLAQFRRACEVAMHTLGLSESEATAYVWHDGRFDVRVRELLSEDVTY